MKKYLLYGLLFVVILFSVHSLLSKNTDTSITIGAPLALSGDGSAWGEEDRNGILLALEDLNRDDSGVITINPGDHSVTKPNIFKIVKDGVFVEIE